MFFGVFFFPCNDVLTNLIPNLILPCRVVLFTWHNNGVAFSSILRQTFRAARYSSSLWLCNLSSSLFRLFVYLFIYSFRLTDTEFTFFFHSFIISLPNLSTLIYLLTLLSHLFFLSFFFSFVELLFGSVSFSLPLTPFD